MIDPSILLQSRPVDLNELGDSLNPAAIYQNGLKIRQQKQQLQTEGLQQQAAQTQLSEQQRQIAQDKAIRETYSKADFSTPEGVHSFLESIKANPLTADKYPDAVKSVVEQGQNQAKLSGIQEYAKLYGPTSNAPENSGVIGNPGIIPTQGIQGSYHPQQAQPQVDLSQKIVGLKNKSAYETYLGLPPKSALELNQAYLDAQKAADSDLNSPEWIDKIHSIPPGKLGDAQILHTQFVDSHPYIRQLPKEQQDQSEKAFVAPQQTNMAAYIDMQSKNSGGMGKSLRDQVDAGNLEGKDAISSILNNRFLNPQAKQKELIEFAQGSGNSTFTVPQLKVFAKNAADPQNNRTIAAINAVEPNLQKIVQYSDQNGRLNIPLLNKAIQAGEFQFGDHTITDMQELQRIIAEEAGRVFGGTATSDFKIKLGGQTVDLSLGQNNFGETMRVLSDALQNKKGSLTQGMGPYSPWGKLDAQHPENKGFQGGGKIVYVKGVPYTVGADGYTLTPK